jgi:hypothetical protein
LSAPTRMTAGFAMEVPRGRYACYNDDFSASGRSVTE